MTYWKKGGYFRVRLAGAGGLQPPPPPPPYPPPPGTRGPESGRCPACPADRGYGLPTAAMREQRYQQLIGSNVNPASACAIAYQCGLPAQLRIETLPLHTLAPPATRAPATLTPATGEKQQQDIRPPPVRKESEDDAQLRARIESTFIDSPNVKWDEVVGLGETPEEIEAIVREPLDNKSSNITWSGILLYGPPGTGKTLMAKAIATTAHPAKFMSLSSADLGGQYTSQSERLVKMLFTVARERVARDHTPVVIFIDEIDSLLRTRTTHDESATAKVKTQFLIEMEGLGKDRKQILVIGATNNPWDLDDAVLSRLRQRYYVGLPDQNGRQQIIQSVLVEKGSKPLSPAGVATLATQTRGMSGRELRGLVEASAIAALLRRRRQKISATNEITLDDLQKGLMRTGRATTITALEKYKTWAKDHGLQTDEIDRDLLELQQPQTAGSTVFLF